MLTVKLLLLNLPTW